MFISVRNRSDDKQTHGACVGKSERVQISTEHGSFSIEVAETHINTGNLTETGLSISVNGCDKLLVLPNGPSSVTLVHRK